MSKKVILIVAAVLLVCAPVAAGVAYVAVEGVGTPVLWALRQYRLLSVRGGPEVVLEVDGDDVRRRANLTLRANVAMHLRDAKMSFSTRQTDAGVEVSAQDADREAVLNVLRSKFTSVIDIRLADDGVIHVSRPDLQLAERTVEAARLSQALLEARFLDLNIQAVATVQPQRSGARLLVRMSRSEDPQRLIKLATRAGELTFRMIDVSMAPEKALRSAPPSGTDVLYGRMEQGKLPYLVEKRAVITGRDLESAAPILDQRTNEPVVTFRFNTAGTRKFGQATAENVGRPMAIVVDGEVLSAPIIREPITGGSGQISGNFTLKDANELAAVLRYGALPARLKVVEEHAAKAQ